jgi:hypothetical protein
LSRATADERHEQRGAGEGVRHERQRVGRRRAGDEVRLRQCEWRARKQRLPHHPLGGDHFLDARLDVVLVNAFHRIGTGFSRGRKRGLQHRVPDVAAAHFACRSDDQLGS